MWSFWLVNLFCLAGLGINMTRQFSEYHEEKMTMNIPEIGTDTINVSIINQTQNGRRQLGPLVLEENHLTSKDVRMGIVSSKNSEFKVTYYKKSRGLNNVEAKLLSNQIDFTPTLEGNELAIQNAIQINKGSKWRNQEVYIELEVPEGKTIKFTSLDDLNQWGHFDTSDNDFSVWDNQDEYWSMTKDGLFCQSCNPSERILNDLDKYKNFTEINIEAPVKVTIEKADIFDIEIEGSSRSKKRLELVQTGDKLNIFTEKRNNSLSLDIHIKMPNLYNLDLENTDDIRLIGFEQNKMRINYTGKNDLKAFINIDSIYINQNGRNELDISGKGKYMSLVMDNHSKMDAKNYEVDIVDIKATDHCEAKLNVNNFLRQRQEESKIDVERGEPEIIEL